MISQSRVAAVVLVVVVVAAFPLTPVSAFTVLNFRSASRRIKFDGFTNTSPNHYRDGNGRSTPIVGDVRFPALFMQSSSSTHASSSDKNETEDHVRSVNATASPAHHAPATVDTTESMKHKLIVLEDVVNRLHRKNNQLSSELKTSRAELEQVKTKLTETTTRGRETVSTERIQHRQQVEELKEKLEVAEEAKSMAREKNREKFEQAKEKAIEQHQRLDAKAKKFEDQLASAHAKLDEYRKQSYERESKLRQTLRDEQEARKQAEATNQQAIAKVEELKATMSEQKETVEEQLLISEAAVTAAERREAELKKALSKAEAEIVALRKLGSTGNTTVESDTQTKKMATEISELQNLITSMHQKFDAERQRERQQWAREIEALQEALENARTEKHEPPAPTMPASKRASRPNIIRRIGRKLLHH